MVPDEFKTRIPLVDLGTTDPRWRGIWSPAYSQELVAKFIHNQFLDGAGTYLRKYQASDHWRYLLQQAHQHFTLPAGPLRVLDVGSGGGNTIFPLLDLYPDASVIASDLSLPLLRALKQAQEESYGGRRCYVMQLNAEELIFEDGQFDLVVGAAILHHLFDPERALKETYRVLKPGGVALFFEPFELGHQVVALALREMTVVNDFYRALGAAHALIPDDVHRAFQLLVNDFRMRRGSDKSAPLFHDVDDKWLFTRSYLERAMARCGFARLTVYDLYPTEPLVTNQVRSLLRLKLGHDMSFLPGWALSYLEEMDGHFSVDAREELIGEGGIVLEKAE